MQFRILGALEASANGAVAELGSPKQRALLAILLMHVGEIVPTDRLIDLLWGEHPPRTAAHSIQIYISELRRSLEPAAGGGRLIATRQPGYQLEAEPGDIDAHRFEHLVEEGTRRIGAGDVTGGAASLRSALALWHGPALSDFAYEEFAQPYIRRLHDLHLDAIEELAAAELDGGRTSEVLPLLESAIREDPLRERSRELLMLALYRSGRHAEALRIYQKLRTLLNDELGLEPSPPVQRMQERILLHDPNLLPGHPAPTAPTASRNPYKGLRPFGEADAGDFFGREVLLDQLIARLRAGVRMIALVGPSGSGKSSILGAGLIPRLRAGAIPGSDRWVIAPILPGPHPIEQIDAVLAKSATLPVGLAQLLEAGDGEGRRRSSLRTMPENARLVLVMDQFEQLFAVADEAVRRRFLSGLAAALAEPDGQIVVLLTLRADFYDRPLLEAAFAGVFIPAITNVLPMTAEELESAVVRPAAQVGVTVEGTLLAELVAETADQAAALPLLQFALTEMFDQRSESGLTLAGYRELGGLRGILSRRAEDLYAAMGPEEQRAVMQVFLRLVRLGRGTIDSRRRISLADLNDLELDPVVLSDVLSTFGRHRLLSFDRDEVTGAATVDVAHEALFREWDRLAGWIDRHRTALRRYETFAAAVEEWELADRDSDYLLTGGRLSEFEAWSNGGVLHLTGREREFLEAALSRRRGEEQEEATRSEAHRRLEGRARVRLVALAIAAVLLAGTTTFGIWAATADAVPRVALLHSGTGALDAVGEDGFDNAVSDFNLAGKDVLYDGLHGAESLRALSEAGTGLVLVPEALIDFDDWQPVVRAHPGTKFVLSFPYEAANVSYLRHTVQEGSFLAGAAAALTSETHVIGFIGGMDDWFIWVFQAGYEAGAKAVDPDIRLVSTYLTDDVTDPGTAFANPIGARDAAREMYRQGADVVFHAAGGSGIGLFEAATEMSTAARQLWAIGVDTDQYESVRSLTGVVDPEPWRAHILTSVLKKIDLAMYAVLEEFAHGAFIAGERSFDLESNGVGLSFSGGYIDAIRPRIEDFQARIVAGSIVVPCIPVSRTSAAVGSTSADLTCSSE